MEAIFLKLLNMSITAGWIVLAVLAVRLLLRKAPKGLVSLLWILVAVRLVCPFSIESVWSLIPSAETVPEDIGLMQEPAIHSGIPVVNHVVNPILQESFTPEPMNSVNPMQVVTWAAARIWLLGVAVMILYVGISYGRVYRRVRVSLALEEGVRVCDEIGGPFILGVFRPVIYLPSGLEGKDREFVLAHERAHLKRKDHLWKPLAYAILTVYWFHPILWVGYLFFSRDIEMACDERVIRKMDAEEKKEYTRTLLACSVAEKQLPACPLAFGEVGVKGRVKSMKNYKKPSVILAVLAVAALMLGGVFFLTTPKNQEREEELEQALVESIENSMVKWGFSDYRQIFEDHVVLGTQKHTDGVEVYMMVYAEQHLLREEGKTEESSFHGLMAVTLKETEDGYETVEVWQPKDGNEYVKSIREKLPWYLWGKVDTQDYIKEQQERVHEQAAVWSDRLQEQVQADEMLSGNMGKLTPVDFDYEVTYVGKESISELYEGALGVYQMAMSYGRFYPVHSLNSVEELKLFREKIPDKTVLKEGYAAYESYDDVMAKYDESFFEENTLLQIYVSGSVGDTFCVDSVVGSQVDQKKYLSVFIGQEEPVKGLPMAASSQWILSVEVKKEEIQDVSAIYATNRGIYGVAGGKSYSYARLPVTYDMAYVGYLDEREPATDYQGELEYIYLEEIRSYEDFEFFRLKSKIPMDQSYDGFPSLGQILDLYDKAFFENNFLVCIYVMSDSSSYRYQPTGMICEMENNNPLRLYITVAQTNQPEAVTQDMAGWLLVVPVEREIMNPNGWVYAVWEEPDMEALLFEQKK